MGRLQYLQEHHQITESIIGLVSVQKDIHGVQAVLEVWKPKLESLFKTYLTEVCKDTGVTEKQLYEFMKWE